MKLKPRILSATFAFLLLFTSLVGCGDKQSEETQTDTQAGSNVATDTLNIAVIGADDAQKSAVEKYITAYEAKNPATDAVASYLNESPDSLEGYDAVLLSAFEVLKYVPTQLADITSAAQADEDYGNITDSAKSLGCFSEGTVYIPFNYDRAVIYADKQVFESASVQLPTDTYSFGEFETVLKKLSGRNSVGINVSSSQPYVWKYILETNGDGWYGETVIAEDYANESAMKSFYALFRKGYAVSDELAVSDEKLPAAMSWSWACESKTVSGEASYDPAANAEALAASGNLAVLSLPYGDGFSGSVMNTDFIHGIAVVKGSEKADKAADFALFSLELEGAALLNEGFGGIPVNKTHFSEAYWKKGKLACENSDAFTENTDSDIRSDFADALPVAEGFSEAHKKLVDLNSEHIAKIKYRDSNNYYLSAWRKFTNGAEEIINGEKMKSKNFICQIEENSSIQMMSYVIVSNGEIAVIDGGNLADGEKLLETLRQITGSDKPTVDKWLFTHAHADHLNAFVSIMTKTPNDIEVKSVYYNLIDKQFYTENGSDTAFVYDTFIEQVEMHIPEAERHIVQIGDKIGLGEASFEVMYVPENKFVNNIINNTSVAYMLTMCGQKVLFLGDAGEESGDSMLEMYKNGELKADIVQMAHHGQAGVKESFYKEVSPSECLWPTPLWLWNNDAGLGYNTHVFKTVEVRGWIEKLGVKKNYATFEGTTVLTFPREFSE